MNWIQLFVFGFDFLNLWNKFTIQTNLCISFIDDLVTEKYNNDEFNITKNENNNFSIILFPRTNLNNDNNTVDETPPIPDFFMNFELLNIYFIYYKLLKLLESDKVSVIEKIQHIENVEITKDLKYSSYSHNLFKNLLYDDW